MSECVDGIEYRLSPRVSGRDLSALFAEAWPDRGQETDFGPVLSRSLGYVCAYRAGELVGFVNVATDGGAHAFLLDTTVRADCRRRGIGRQLVRQAEQLARKGGAEWLHVDFEPGLEGFYHKCGFRESRAGLINLREVKDQPESGKSGDAVPECRRR
jgi:GNAT superfamily N-acetyltransferase